MPTLTLKNEEKSAKYKELLPQIAAVIDGEDDLIANMGNICAMLKEAFGWLWVGFYRIDNEAKQLVLGPFQGPLACTRIPFGKGVCGEVWQNKQTQIVDDVLKHPNHIACSSLSRSEIVLPLFAGNSIVAVLDIDSEKVGAFDAVDKEHLTKLTELLNRHSQVN